MVVCPSKNLGGPMPEELRNMIEREAMRVIDEKRKHQGLTIDDLAKCLYPEKNLPAARMMIQRLVPHRETSLPVKWILVNTSN